ncbi:MAG: hypothetical protein LQ343_007839 [Gyalolechia ehrenbergii]|nr:MAG: hypothetical protein LQ343_007839 [Gyalolechia ehrenbergii]
MSSPRRQSPRAAILEWLAQADPGSTVRAKGRSEPQRKERQTHRKRRRPSHFSHGESRQSQPQPQAENTRKILEDRLRHQTRRKAAEDYPNDAHTGHTLADQLGLHAPFLSFATRGTDVIPDGERDRKRRRRSPSATSSYLEPAACFRRDSKGPGNQRDVEAETDRHLVQHNNVAIPSRSSSATVVSPEKPAKGYEKRSRHRTREDRYVLKQDKKRDKPKEGGKVTGLKAKRRRKRTEKSGAALMHNFSANNVEPERLTLKGTAPLGLFGKGRASSPVRRIGLPDLTFSEMNFLNRRKAEAEENLRPQRKKSRGRKEKAADAEAEISRFFASSKDQSRTAEGSRRHRASKRPMNEMAERTQEQQRSSLPPIDLPKKPFLGFGSCGPGHVSPVLSVSNAESRRSPSRRPSFNRSTTYYTWSQTRLSEHSPSSNPCRSPRLRSESKHKPHLNLDLSTRRRKRNLWEEEQASPAAQDSDKESHVVGDHIPPLASGVPERLSKSPVKEDHRKTNGHQEAEIHPNYSSLTTLPSILAFQNRPEQLGAVLDALLGRVTNPNSEACQEPGPARPPGSGSKEQVSVPEVIPGSQTPHESNNPNAQGSVPSESYHADSSNVVASGHQPCPSQRPKSSHDTNFQVADQPPSRISPMRMPPGPVQENPPGFGQPNIRRNQLEGDQTVGTAIHGPSASNAWMGYDNIYQGQEETPKSCRQGNPSNIFDVADEGHERCAQLKRPDSDASNYGIDNQSHNLYEYQPISYSQDLAYFVEDRLGSPNYANLQINKGAEEDIGPLHVEGFDAGQAKVIQTLIKAFHE